MLRRTAIRALLHEHVLGLGPGDDLSAESRRELLRSRRRRGAILVAAEWIAILLLVLSRDPALPFLTLGPEQQTLFSIGILVVVAHSGFKLGQLEKLRAVERAIEELDRLDGSG